MSELEEIQIAVADRFGLTPEIPDDNLNVGIADNVRSGAMPINALRHAPHRSTSGWYIWAGEELSQHADFFQALHVSHVGEWCPEILPYLALPPGWRVLLAPGHEDVWFDQKLL